MQCAFVMAGRDDILHNSRSADLIRKYRKAPLKVRRGGGAQLFLMEICLGWVKTRNGCLGPKVSTAD